METTKDLPIVFFKSQPDFETWLEAHHSTARGVWVKIAKKQSGIESVSQPEALDAALCFGWIDGQRLSYDESYYLQKYSPRRPGSKWSKINCEKVTELTAKGKMRPAGLREVALARQNGRWDNAYASPRNITVPDDLQKKLDENPRARDFFATLNSRNRYAILYQIYDAKKPETRLRRIEKYVTMLNEQKTIY